MSEWRRRYNMPKAVADSSIYRYRDMDPIQWVHEELGVKLWSKQREILESTFAHRKTVVRSCHAAGKTFTAASIALAFMFTRQPCKIITTAPTWYQVKDLLWSEMNSLFRERLEPKGLPGKALSTGFKMRDDWFALGLSPKESVNFQGFHSSNILVIFDEAPGVRPQVIEGADSLMSSGDAHMLWIGNPTESSGHFFNAFSQSDWNTFHISYRDTPNFTDEDVADDVKAELINSQWVDDKRRDWGDDDPRFQSRVLGDFPEHAEDQLISLKWVEDAQARKVQPSDNGVLSIDVARFGDDKTVYSAVFGNVLKWQKSESKKDTMEIVGHAINIFKKGGFSGIRVDDVGVGGGVTDRLRELKMPVTPVNAGSKAFASNDFINRRAEMWWGARDWLRDSGQIPKIPLLIEDLVSPKYTYTSTGKIKVESKDDIKERILRSTDYGDSFVQGIATFPQYGWRKAKGV